MLWCSYGVAIFQCQPCIESLLQSLIEDSISDLEVLILPLHVSLGRDLTFGGNSPDHDNNIRLATLQSSLHQERKRLTIIIKDSYLEIWKVITAIELICGIIINIWCASWIWNNCRQLEDLCVLRYIVFKYLVGNHTLILFRCQCYRCSTDNKVWIWYIFWSWTLCCRAKSNGLCSTINLNIKCLFRLTTFPNDCRKVCFWFIVFNSCLCKANVNS